MEIKNSEKQNSNKSKNKKIIILIIILLLLIIVLMQFGYSKYIEIVQSETTVKVAKLICEMEVTQSKDDETIINPYCMVTVKDFNSNDEVSQTDVNYKIQVTPKEDFEMPEYYWEDSKGTVVARSTEVTGSFKNGVKKTDEYKIVFLNTGIEDITKVVKFDIIAEQGI